MKEDLGIARVYRIKENLFAVDEIGRTILYVYAGEGEKMNHFPVPDIG